MFLQRLLRSMINALHFFDFQRSQCTCMASQGQWAVLAFRCKTFLPSVMKSTYFLLLQSFGCFEVDFCGLSEIKSLSVIHLYPKSLGDFPFFSLPLHASSSHKHELHPCNQVDDFLVLQCPQQHSPCQAIVCGSRVWCGGRVHSGKRLQQARLLQSLPCSRQGGVI